MDHRSEVAVGIDLGTTFSVIAHLDQEGRPQTLLSDEGEPTTPSVVFFDSPAAIVGREAVKAARFEPGRVAQFAKRDTGERYYHGRIAGEQIPPEVVQALVLCKLKRDAERKLGAVTKAVVTVPAYFNEPRRKATQDAARLAGIEVLDILNEPTAAALACGIQRNASAAAHDVPRELVLVYDLGGGTFDATLMEIDGTHYHTLATAGDVFLGGLDWDERLADAIADAFAAQHGPDLRERPDAWQQLMAAAAEAKHALTARRQTTVPFDFETRHMRYEISRDEFEFQTADLLERTRFTLRKLLKEARRSWRDITRVLLVGGSTRMPMVRRMLEEESGRRLDRSLSPDEAVAHGAAIYAGALLHGDAPLRETITVRNVNSHDLGVLGVEPATRRPRRRVMIPRNTPLPASCTGSFETARSGQRDVVVRIVEGGSDSGDAATHIGRCVISDLPPQLPARTPVKVTFVYEHNGRLTVHASLPRIQRKATLKIERHSGMSPAELQSWGRRIQNGLSLAPASRTTDGPSREQIS